MSVSQDGSESVDQFLARIASVRETRDQASEDRTKRMEEDFLRNRKERQARRLERARSLSPSKTGPAVSTTTSPSMTASRETALNPPIDFSPRTSTLSRSNAVSARTSPKLEPRLNEPNQTPTLQNSPINLTSRTGPSRSGTLSWQQRPPRDGGASRPRPLSSIETLRTGSKVENVEEERPEPSRQEIAASLGKKDPMWFRQTQDRGLGSAAFRKNQVEDTNTVEHVARSGELPGMSRDVSRSENKTPARETGSPASFRERQLSPPLDDRTRREPSPVSALLLDAPNLEPSPRQPPKVDPQNESTSNTLSRSGSTLAGRPPSPTKGLGGFVESAMMKRSDSISKRWSVQASAGLKRGDSVAGARPLTNVRSMHTSTLSRNSNRDVSPSPAPVSRPESRESVGVTLSRSATPDKKQEGDETFKPAPKPSTVITVERPGTPVEDQLSRSPSKTLDSRRWSPTKSSWLESALLSKPEPPKPQPMKEEVPAWKATLQRNKASRDLSPTKVKHDNSNATSPIQEKSRKTILTPVPAKRPTPEKQEAKPSNQASEVHPAPSEIEKGISSPLPISERSPTRAVTKDSGDPSNTKPDLPSAKATEKATAALGSDDKNDKKPPLVLKPKPQTPPKTDFRSTLKSRAPVAAGDKIAEPEFKSIFGKLKPAHTQNYVAPDTLKKNILTGKAALNTTGGPQKQDRVDEFKESILQKKEAMKASAIQKKETPATDVQPPKPDAIVPEALARRKTLSKAPPPIAKLQDLVGTSQSASKVQSTTANKSKPAAAQAPSAPVKSSTNKNPAAKIMIEKAVPPPVDNASDASTVQPLTNKSDTAESEQKPRLEAIRPQRQADTISMPSVSLMAQKVELPAGSKLASRLNPNLAAFLSRGSNPLPASSRSPSPERLPADKRIEPDEAANAGELTHMTKGRAKGPKRRAPKSQPAPADTSMQEKPTDREPKPKTAVEPNPTIESTTPTSPIKSFRSPREAFTVPPVIRASPNMRSTPITTPVKVEHEIAIKPTKSVESAGSKPTVATKSPELRKTSSTLSPQQVDGPTSKPSTSTQFNIAADADAVTPEVRSALRALPKTPQLATTVSPLTPSKSRINTPKPTQSPVEPPVKPQGPKPTTGLGLSVKPASAKQGARSGELTPPPDKPVKPSVSVKPQINIAPSKDLGPIISAYFPELPEKQQRADFDAQDLLQRAKALHDKIKTISHTIQEINSDGKKTTMPSQQEHILYEESMYLVTHRFETGAGGKASEVYLWCGDDAADAAVEDAQLFCRRDARDHNTKLEVIRQGKEPARFFQALGGILIVRRTKSSSLYMLRGRRHLGHVAFDEVDLTSSSLCSGFSHLVSAKFGKLYLWKGEGSGADEVGCARLIGMDLGLTGEIEEVAEGQEPPSFWESFPPREASDTWSKDWQRRADHDGYPSMLYKVDIDQPKPGVGGFWGLRAASPAKSSNKIAIEMVDPFCDRDLEPTHVYVLDAYRSIYVILDPQAAGKTTEFVAALDLAQELAMLAPSVQDRSLMPSCHVVFGEPPTDVKVCFRKWSGKRPSKHNNPSACVRLEEVMDAMKL